VSCTFSFVNIDLHIPGVEHAAATPDDGSMSMFTFDMPSHERVEIAMTIMSDAARTIGSGSPGDHRLSPIEHAEQLRTSAPTLAAILTRRAPVELARQYAEADTEALLAERTFKRWVIWANWAVLATATVSAPLMAVALLAGTLGVLTQTILIVLALIGVADRSAARRAPCIAMRAFGSAAARPSYHVASGLVVARKSSAPSTQAKVRKASPPPI
jgi:hypothetical protein